MQPCELSSPLPSLSLLSPPFSFTLSSLLSFLSCLQTDDVAKVTLTSSPSPQLLKCWDYRQTPQSFSYLYFLKLLSSLTYGEEGGPCS